MALDDRGKRASATSLVTIARVPGLDNTSMDQAQRQASVWGYSGIAADSPAAGGAANPVISDGGQSSLVFGGQIIR